MENKLALNGGTPVKNTPFGKGQRYDDAEMAEIRDTFDHGSLIYWGGYKIGQLCETVKKALTCVSFGGGCVNDVIIHLATSEMGFGGVGESGMGSYHGLVGFNTFSHLKSIVDKKTWLDLPMRYQPYDRDFFGSLLKMFLR